MIEHFIKGFEKVALSDEEKREKVYQQAVKPKSLMAKTMLGGGALGAGLGAGIGGGSYAIPATLLSNENPMLRQATKSKAAKKVLKDAGRLVFREGLFKALKGGGLAGGLGGLALGGLIGAKALKMSF